MIILHNAISPETADNLIGELFHLEPSDLTQLRRSINKLSDADIVKLKDNISAISHSIHNIRYGRKPATKHKYAQKYKEEKVKKLVATGEYIPKDTDGA